MNSKAPNDPLSSNSPTLLIDFRCGSVEMLHAGERWRGALPMSAADQSQINTSSGLVTLAKIDSESLPANVA